MGGYTKLYSDILTSSVWNEDNETRIVWITLLALAGYTGYVHCAMPSLALLSRVELSDCEKAIATLKAPDKYSRTSEYEGRRIEDVEGGWNILNYEKHRNRMSNAKDLSNDPKRVYQREWVKKKRMVDKESTGVDSGRHPASVSESESESESSPKGGAGGFQKPTPEEVTAYAKTKGIDLDGLVFWSFYESNGWRVGKNPMKSWKAAVTGTWGKNNQRGAQHGNDIARRRSDKAGREYPENIIVPTL